MARVSLWFWLTVAATGMLLAGGVAMVTSTSVWTLQANPDDRYADVRDHVMWLGLGLIAWLVGASVRYQKWRDWLPWLVPTSLVLLVCCFVPGIGREIYGESRWISLPLPGPLGKTIQPSEFAKFVVVLLLAYWFSKEKIIEKRHTLLWGILLPLAMVGVFAALIAAEVDIGTTMVVLATSLVVIFFSGARIEYLIFLVGAAAFLFVPLVEAVDPDKLQRITAWQDLEAHKTGDSYQQVMGLRALSSGGWFGVGLGNSTIKIHELPFAHTDFVAAIVGDEFGLIGTLATVLFFLTIGIGGIQIGTQAPDRFGQVLGAGLVSLIVIQAMLNFAVVTALVPNTGLPLPFISYGGTNLVMSLFFIGVLTNIYRQGRSQEGVTEAWVKRKRRSVRW